MFHVIEEAYVQWGLLTLVAIGAVMWGWRWLRGEMKRRAEQALLASVVDHFIHDRVRNDRKLFERDRLYATFAFLLFDFPFALSRGLGRALFKDYELLASWRSTPFNLAHKRAFRALFQVV